MERLGSRYEYEYAAALLEVAFADASARELRRGWGPKEKDELMEWRGPVGWLALFVRDPDGEGARGIAKPVGGVAAIAW